jgi:hypothetical protein
MAVRTEIDVYVTSAGKAKIVGDIQRDLVLFG